MTFVYLKDIIHTILPLILCQLAFQYFYQVNIFKVAVWWIKHHNEVEYQHAVYIGIFFVFLTIWAASSSMINNITFALNGEQNEMIYVGDIAQNTALLYQKDNLIAPPVKDYNLSTKPLSFANIYKEVTYQRNKGSTKLGLPKTTEGFSWSSLISTICFLIAFAPLFFALIHSMAYVVSMKIEIMNFNPDFSWKDAWVQIYEPYGVTLKKMLISSAFFLFVPIIVFSFYFKNDSSLSPYGPKVLNLPMNISPGYEVDGVPVKSYRVVSQGTGNATDTDTGKRRIIFRFIKDFKLPVYVTYEYNAKQFPELEKLTDHNIRLSIPMKVKILDDMSIGLVL